MIRRIANLYADYVTLAVKALCFSAIVFLLADVFGALTFQSQGLHQQSTLRTVVELSLGVLMVVGFIHVVRVALSITISSLPYIRRELVALFTILRTVLASLRSRLKVR